MTFGAHVLQRKAVFKDACIHSIRVANFGRKMSRISGAEWRGIVLTRSSGKSSTPEYGDWYSVSLDERNSSKSSRFKNKGDEYFETDRRPIILFDGVCNLCNGGVNFMLDWDRTGKARFAALQSPAGKVLLERSGRNPDDISSIVLVEKDESYIKSDAILRIGKLLEVPFPVLAGLGMLVPHILRDTVYDGIATNRYNMFGSTNECRLSDSRFEERFLS